MRVLITSSRMPFALDAIRKLGSQGHEAFATDSYKTSPGSHSRYLAGHFATASPSADQAQFADDVARRGAVDVLVNNAGILGVPFTRSADGVELQLATNHLGHFALANLLLPLLTDRVVVVSSQSHRHGDASSVSTALLPDCSGSSARSERVGVGALADAVGSVSSSSSGSWPEV